MLNLASLTSSASASSIYTYFLLVQAVTFIVILLILPRKRYNNKPRISSKHTLGAIQDQWAAKDSRIRIFLLFLLVFALIILCYQALSLEVSDLISDEVQNAGSRIYAGSRRDGLARFSLLKYVLCTLSIAALYFSNAKSVACFMLSYFTVLTLLIEGGRTSPICMLVMITTIYFSRNSWNSIPARLRIFFGASALAIAILVVSLTVYRSGSASIFEYLDSDATKYDSISISLIDQVYNTSQDFLIPNPEYVLKDIENLFITPILNPSEKYPTTAFTWQFFPEKANFSSITPGLLTSSITQLGIIPGIILNVIFLSQCHLFMCRWIRSTIEGQQPKSITSFLFFMSACFTYFVLRSGFFEVRYLLNLVIVPTFCAFVVKLFLRISLPSPSLRL